MNTRVIYTTQYALILVGLIEHLTLSSSACDSLSPMLKWPLMGVILRIPDLLPSLSLPSALSMQFYFNMACVYQGVG